MPLNSSVLKKVAWAALREDAAQRDVTTLSFISGKVKAEAKILAKEEGIVCGISMGRQVFKVFDPHISFKALKDDGDRVSPGSVIALLKGKARSILSCERVALTFLSYLSGISTQTYEAVRKVRRQGIKILDTRKTTPFLRAFEKYAVLMGQGRNHRFDLSEQYLVKDNHLFILRKTKTLPSLSYRERSIPFEIEVESLRDLKKALTVGPDIVMLDNFSPQEVKRAVAFIRRMFARQGPKPLIELSGGITLKNISRYAIKGVDFISLGSLTHSAQALDLSLEITKVHSR